LGFDDIPHLLFFVIISPVMPRLCAWSGSLLGDQHHAEPEGTIEFFNLVAELGFTEQEKKDLLAFLRAL